MAPFILLAVSSIWQTGCKQKQPAFVDSVRYYGKLRGPGPGIHPIDFWGGVVVIYQHIVAAGGMPAAGMWWICAVGICACRASGALFDIGRRPSIRLPSGRVWRCKSLPRPSSERGGIEATAAPKGRCQRDRKAVAGTYATAYDASGEIAKFQELKRSTKVALRGDHVACLLIMF